MISNSKISVIIPVYKVEKYLNRCVQSIVDQTYKNLEIILVDDGSPDNCPAMCDAWAKKDNRIKVIHKKNGGAYSARNTGLDAATGDYIGFVDGDDYILSQMYDTLYGLITEYKTDAAACAILRESSNGYIEDWSDGSLHLFDNTELLQWVGTAEGLIPVHLGNKLFSVACINGIRFQNFKYAEDVLFNFQVSLKIKSLIFKSDPFYHYNNNYESISHVEFNEARFDEHKVMDIIFDLVKDKPDVLSFCIKGDVLKSFRTIKEMCTSGKCLNRFSLIRDRIISHKNEIFKSGLYSKATKLKTLLLLLLPEIYKRIIKLYGIYSSKKYRKLTEN